MVNTILAPDARGLEGPDDRGSDQAVVTGHVHLDIGPADLLQHSAIVAQQALTQADREQPSMEGWQP